MADKPWGGRQQLRWQHVGIPRIAVLATFCGIKGQEDLLASNLQSMLLDLTDPEAGDARLPLSLNPDDAPKYEDPYSALFLESFSDYEERRRESELIVAGSLGIAASRLTVIEARELLQS